MMKSYLTSALLLLSLAATAQYRLDIGLHNGLSNYLGEMGGNQDTRKDFVKDMKLSRTHYAGGLFVRYKVHPFIALQGNFSYGRISGDDRLSQNKGRAGRNLNFRNDIIELGITSQFRLVQFSDIGRTFRFRNDFRAYTFAGIAGFHHNPKAYYSGTWINLQPLRTEGQVEPYSRVNIAVPMGIGFYFTRNRAFRIGWELGWRKTFTDYLDDVSTTYADPGKLNNPLAQDLSNRTDELAVDESFAANYLPGNKRGDPTHKDTYIFSTVSVSYVIKGKSRNSLNKSFSRPRYKDNYDFSPIKHRKRRWKL